ncbi:MAG: hypothetical protein GYA52_12070 [Chloroflexi bacterium]|nr:hypothetical protein [Chloroflexota bacterium]
MKKMIGMISFLMLAVVLLSACTQQPAAETTPDLGEVKTQAVQTAVSQMTADAESMVEEPAVEQPTITPLPTIGAAVPTATSYASSSGSTSSSGSSGGSTTYSGSPVPTWTPVVYDCQVVGQTPVDGNQYVGADVDVYWTLKNTGAATWKAGQYYYHWTGYSDLSPTHMFYLASDVAPYGTITVQIDVKVPTTIGQYRTQWYLVNDNGEDFCGFYYYVNAIALPTATP